jgi:hypothetical protein
LPYVGMAMTKIRSQFTSESSRLSRDTKTLFNLNYYSSTIYSSMTFQTPYSALGILSLYSLATTY